MKSRQWVLKREPRGEMSIADFESREIELDPASLAGNVLLVDLDAGAPVAASVEWNAAGGGYWPARTLAVHPDYQIPPRAGARTSRRGRCVTWPASPVGCCRRAAGATWWS